MLQAVPPPACPPSRRRSSSGSTTRATCPYGRGRGEGTRGQRNAWRKRPYYECAQACAPLPSRIGGGEGGSNSKWNKRTTLYLVQCLYPPTVVVVHVGSRSVARGKGRGRGGEGVWDVLPMGPRARCETKWRTHRRGSEAKAACVARTFPSSFSDRSNPPCPCPPPSSLPAHLAAEFGSTTLNKNNKHRRAYFKK